MHGTRTGFRRLDLADGVDAAALSGLVPDVDAMSACVQDAVFHAEGDAWTHTLMVCRALSQDPRFLGASPEDREVLSWAALLHDIAKPATRTEEWDPEAGRTVVRHPRHAPRGAVMAHAHLYRLGAPPALRTLVHALIDGHQAVFHLLAQEDWEERAVRRSLSRPWGMQVDLARADIRGRIAADNKAGLDNVDLVEMAVRELGCLDAPHAFPSEQALAAFGRDPSASRHREPPPPRGSRVVILVGLPGVGKDTYSASAFPDVPVISFDAIRREMGFVHGDKDGRALQAAYEAVRVRLRAKEPFVWNATGLTRMRRARITGLCMDYDAEVEIRVLEAPYRMVLSRNAARATAIPSNAIEHMVDGWEPVQPWEAHRVRTVDLSGKANRHETVVEEPAPPGP